MTDSSPVQVPPRFERPGVLSCVLFVGFVVFVAWSLSKLEISVPELIEYFPSMIEIAGEMVPPSTDRLGPVVGQLLVTFQMAFLGCLFGVLLALPLAFLAARNHSPHPLVHVVARSLIMFLRTIPELIWALLFIVWVGLGPFAGVLAIIVDTVGFTGRFFAESLEEVDPGPGEALSAIGAGSVSRFACATVPGALPGMVNTTLFGLEKAVRASVILGLVGAGGIGVELSTSMETFRFDQASMIIVLIFLMIFGVERLSSWIRSKLL